jgi:predicted nucleic acid-binding protein
VSLHYLDTSAALKLLRAEEHSTAMAAFYDKAVAEGHRFASSDLLRIELLRAVTRADPQLLPEARALLAAISTIEIDEEIVQAASNETDRMLRTLDAIHLASARAFGADLTTLLTYDDRLAQAAKDAGIPARIVTADGP